MGLIGGSPGTIVKNDSLHKSVRSDWVGITSSSAFLFRENLPKNEVNIKHQIPASFEDPAYLSRTLNVLSNSDSTS
jgi:hypothetical protein